MKILIADSSAFVSIRLKSMILEVMENPVVFQANCFTEAWELFCQHQMTVVIIDITLPLNMAIVLLQKIKASNNKTCVLILSINDDKFIKQQYLSAGADHYLDKYHEFKTIVEIIASAEGRQDN